MEPFGFWRHTWWGPLIHRILILTYCFPGLLQCFKLWFIFIGLWVNFHFPGSQLLLFLGFLFALMEDGIHPQIFFFLIFRKVYGRWTFWLLPTWNWLYFISYLIDSLADHRIHVWNISHPELQTNFSPVF